jgi:hypothetical protein
MAEGHSASAADSAAKVTGRLGDLTAATNHIRLELARAGRERSEYNSLIVIPSAIYRSIMFWSHICHENPEVKNNPSATPPTSLKNVSNSLVRYGGTGTLGWVRERVCPTSYISLPEPPKLPTLCNHGGPNLFRPSASNFVR